MGGRWSYATDRWREARWTKVQEHAHTRCKREAGQGIGAHVRECRGALPSIIVG